MKFSSHSFSACMHKGKPVVFDATAKVYYFGFRTLNDAMSRARELNLGLPRKS